MPSTCHHCGAEIVPGFRFCGHCGAALESAPEVSAERRQLTVVFCDLVGSTALSERLDPEELRDLVRRYQSEVYGVVARLDGHVAQYLGDGVLIYFGFPSAHEDDARRAVEAALDILERVERFAAEIGEAGGPRPAVRLGIHTGPVVTGEVGAGSSRERLALGQTPNIAARIQSLADPGTALLSESTHTLVRGYFELRDLGPRELKGVSRPLGLYQVAGRSAAGSRFDLAREAGLTPAVGRRKELAVLRQAFDRARHDGARAVLIRGEGGVGKSRLVEMFTDEVRHATSAWFPLRCSPFHADSAYRPVLELLERRFRIRPEDPRQAKLEALARGLRRALRGTEVAVEDAAPLLASMMALDPEAAPGLKGAPARRRDQIRQLFHALLAGACRRGPAVVVVEDLHWIDPSTLELVDRAVTGLAELPVLLLLTCRPSFHSPWSEGLRFGRLDLDQLSEPEVRAMVRHLTMGKELPPELVRQVVDKTDGVPLYVEELTKAILESGLVREAGGRFELGDVDPAIAIPVTLQDTLMSRLDRLGGAKRAAQVCAALGREFTLELVRAVSEEDSASLERHLARLIDAGLLYRRTDGGGAGEAFGFRHALIQEAAYESVLRSQRAQLHGRVARVLTHEFRDTAHARPDEVAHHCTQAHLAEPAIEWWLRAARAEVERSGYLEAIAHLRRGLSLVGDLPDEADRRRRELDLLTALGPSLIATHGYAAPEVERCYARARELCEGAGETERLFWVLRGLWIFYLVRAKLDEALELARRLLRLAEGLGRPELEFEALHAVALPLFFLGELVPALDHLERGVALAEAGSVPSVISSTGLDTEVIALGISGVVLWLRGFPDRALERARSAVARARVLDHAFSLADALSSVVWLHQLRRDRLAVEEEGRAMLSLAEEKGFQHQAAQAAAYLGWAAAASGDPRAAAEGLHWMGAGIDTYRGSGARVILPFFLCLRAEALRAAGALDAATAALEEGFSEVEAMGGHYAWLPELHRLRGELALARGAAGEAEASFERALELARRQACPPHELRAAMSLGRLLRSSGREERARELVERAYRAFEEGFDTLDLREARALGAGA
jgi:class 3 adenylate cyclase/tetratricopeptide (TPR) repeat protein